MANEKRTSETKGEEKRAGIINDEKFQKLLKEFTEKHKELFYYVIGKCGRASSMSLMYGIHLTLGQIERDTLAWIDRQERNGVPNGEKKSGSD